MFNTRGELQASVEHLTDEHREQLREAEVRAPAVQTRKSLVSCIGRPVEHRDGQWLLIAFYQKLCRIPARTATWLPVEEGVRNVNAATAAFPVESIPVARSHDVVA